MKKIWRTCATTKNFDFFIRVRYLFSYNKYHYMAREGLTARKPISVDCIFIPKATQTDSNNQTTIRGTSLPDVVEGPVGLTRVQEPIRGLTGIPSMSYNMEYVTNGRQNLRSNNSSSLGNNQEQEASSASQRNYGYEGMIGQGYSSIRASDIFAPPRDARNEMTGVDPNTYIPSGLPSFDMASDMARGYNSIFSLPRDARNEMTGVDHNQEQEFERAPRNVYQTSGARNNLMEVTGGDNFFRYIPFQSREGDEATISSTNNEGSDNSWQSISSQVYESARRATGSGTTRPNFFESLSQSRTGDEAPTIVRMTPEEFIHRGQSNARQRRIDQSIAQIGQEIQDDMDLEHPE